MKKFFLSGFIVASVAVALAATHDTKKADSQVNGYGVYCQDYYPDTIPPRDTKPKPDTPPRLKF